MRDRLPSGNDTISKMIARDLRTFSVWTKSTLQVIIFVKCVIMSLIEVEILNYFHDRVD